MGNEEISNSSDAIITAGTKYNIGDLVNYAGTEWRVIKDSAIDEDYVTLMKNKPLTNVELGNYAYQNSDKMEYYWSSTCHRDGIYDGYNYASNDYSGCSGHNNYAESKIKEFLEGTYINSFNEKELKEVDGYKVRLITEEELRNNLSFGSANSIALLTNCCGYSTNVPEWVYKMFNSYPTYSGNGYWTMSPSSSDSGKSIALDVKYENVTGHRYYGIELNHVYVCNRDRIRPVINVFKDNI